MTNPYAPPSIHITSQGIVNGPPDTISGMRPRYDASGRVIGYGPMLGSSGNGAAPVTSSPNNPYANPGLATGANTLAGTPKILGQPAQPATATNPNANFQLLQTTKNPTIAALADKAAKTVSGLQDTQSKTFNDYLNEAKAAQGQIATNVAADTKALTALPDKLAAQLDTVNNAYANTAGGAVQNYADLNQKNAATVAGDVTQLGNLDQQYADASQAAVDRAAQQATGAINARSINPAGSAGNSSDYIQAVLGTNANMQTALQKNLSDMRIQQLTGYITPLQQQLYGNNVQQNQFSANIAQQIAGMRTGSAEQVAAITQAVAGRPLQEVQSLLSSLSLPLSVQQQVMASLPQSLNALTAADNANNFYGLSTNYDGQSITLPSYMQPPVPPTSAYAQPGRGSPTPSNPQPTAPGITSGIQNLGGNPYANPSLPGQTANPVSAPPGSWQATAAAQQAQAARLGYQWDNDLGAYVDANGNPYQPSQPPTGGGGGYTYAGGTLTSLGNTPQQQVPFTSAYANTLNQFDPNADYSGVGP